MSQLWLYGEATNISQSSQELSRVTGTFYDAQGQVIAGADKTVSGFPVFVVPPGGRVPFVLVAYGILTAADYDLSVEALPSSDTPRQDFQFPSSTTSTNAWGDYCVTGTLHNSGGALLEYLRIVAVLYDSQNNVVNFDKYVVTQAVAGNQDVPFTICVDPLEQTVARNELRAWGQ